MNTKANNPKPKELRLLLEEELNLKQRVTFITHPTDKGGTMIDHVWSNMRCECSPLKELDGIKGGDHRAVKMNSDMQQVERDASSQTIKRRDWGKASTKAMVKIIKTEMGAAIAETVSRERAQKRGENAEAILANRHILLSRALAAWDTAWARIKSEIPPWKP